MGTPNVLFPATAGLRPPTGAEVLLVREPSSKPSVIVPETDPILGGLHHPPDLREGRGEMEKLRGEVAAVHPGEEVPPRAAVVALSDGPYYLRHPRAFVEAAVELRRRAGYTRPLYLPGLATPGNLALLVYCGTDLVDSLRVLLESRGDRYLTAEGQWPRSKLEDNPCADVACRGLEEGEGLLAHNHHALLAELRLVRNSVALGSLRELVERRLANDPWNTSVLRHMDLRHHDWQELHAPVAGRGLRAYSHASLTRPEVVRFRRRVREHYRKPPSARVLLLLPCSARKPYSASRSHRLFGEAVARAANPSVVHPVVVTSPMGLVPRELELFHPVKDYDIPVTGDWGRDEAAVVQEDLEAYLKANRYDAIVAHLGAEDPVVKEVVPGATFTGDGKPAEDPSLEALTQALDSAAADLPRVTPGNRMAEALANVACFQFGPGGELLIEGAGFRGRYPSLRIFRGVSQLGMLTALRGMISLTLEGARMLSARDLAWVEIEDFQPKGNIFAVGVEDADPRLRIGDEAIVRHRGEVRAVGVASMTPGEMVEARRGEAVRVRHRIT